ncbi:MAG TPA: hypothetical protein VD886_19565 [Herpetosiphonaceae bacterium]|nr:hypothetical protein [Herpetosiphonaceae bacterium]
MTPSLSLKRFGMGAFVLLLIVAPFILRGAAAAPQAVSWGGTQVVSKTPSQTNAFPVVDYDSNGKIHVAWMEYGADPQGSDSRVLYTNNVDGTWLKPFEVSSSGGRGIEPLVDMKVLGGELHFLYYTNSQQVAHRLVTLSGATPAKGPVTTFTSTKGVNPELVIDSLGRVHAFYASRTSNTAPYQIYHRIRNNNAWSSSTVVRPDGSAQKFPAAAATNDGRVHLAFMGNNSDVVRYSIFNGATWQGSTDIASGKMKQVHLTSDGATLYVMYSAQPGNFHNVYFRQGGNGAWSATVMLSSGSSYDENPFPYYSPAMNTVFTFWSSGSGTTNTRVVVREYVPNVGFSGVTDLGGVAVQWPKAASYGGSISVVWEDKVTRIYDARLRTGNGSGVEPTPQPTVQPTAQPVDFALTRTTASPSNSATVGIQVTSPQGSPDQVRYNLTPFTADNGALAWQALPQTAINVPTGVSGLECGVATIYAQVRNSANGQVSAVKSVSAVVDTAIQGQASISTAENWPGATGLEGQTDAPTNVAPNYTRNINFYFRLTQEPAPCAGLKSYQAENDPILSPSPFPASVNGIATFSGVDNSNDLNGTGRPEQILTANLVLTDNANNQQQFNQTIFYDDDPPVLGQGGTITLPNGLNSDIAVVPIEFTAVVTDDGYTNAAPADKKYWGAWIVATGTPALPAPAVFAQYGKVHQLEAGATSLEYVNLTNASAPGAGQRYLHIRFLDGAGNYTVAGISSPAITLNDNFVEGLNIYMPLIAR